MKNKRKQNTYLLSFSSSTPPLVASVRWQIGTQIWWGEGWAWGRQGVKSTGRLGSTWWGWSEVEELVLLLQWWFCHLSITKMKRTARKMMKKRESIWWGWRNDGSVGAWLELEVGAMMVIRFLFYEEHLFFKQVIW